VTTFLWEEWLQTVSLLQRDGNRSKKKPFPTPTLSQKNSVSESQAYRSQTGNIKEWSTMGHTQQASYSMTGRSHEDGGYAPVQSGHLQLNTRPWNMVPHCQICNC
jgi:hypothetical protein